VDTLTPLRIAFVDDDADLRHATAQSLALAGLKVELFADAQAALDAVAYGFDGIVVTDIRMPGMDGLELFARVTAHDPEIPVILISGHADVTTAVAAVQRGAYDFLTKPYAPDRLILTIRRALEKRGLVLENRRLRAHDDSSGEDDGGSGPLIGSSLAMRHLRCTIASIADMDIDVLVQGETGTGKTVVAGMLHDLGARKRRPMVTVDCGALPDALVESELFGHVSGAFAGAIHPRTGRIEQADGGTLFLDELDSMRSDVQLKLNRVLETREVVPLGGNRARSIDIRVVAASKADLGQAARTGAFNPSLYYRINGLTLSLVPLRERREDVPLMFRIFLGRAAKRLRRDVPTINSRTWNHLRAHDWPGNVRELLRFAEEVAAGLGGEADRTEAETDLRSRVHRFEADAIRSSLHAVNGNVAVAIERLGLPRKTFYDKVARHKIVLKAFKTD